MLEVFKRCFSVNLNEYENINIDLEINKAVVIASVVFALFVVFFNTYRAGIRTMVHQLIRHGARSEESAKTLSELGLKDNRIIKPLLMGDTLLTKVVGRVGEKRYTYDEYKKLSKAEKEDKIDFSGARFYIREDQTDRAEKIVERYAVSTVRTVITCVLIGIVCICIIACMPGILNIVNSLLDSIKM